MLDVDHQKRRLYRVAAVRHRLVTVSGITASPSFKWLTPTSPPASAVSRSQQSTNKRTSLLAAAHLRVEAKVSLEKRYTTPFSATGRPSTSSRWGTAVKIMLS